MIRRFLKCQFESGKISEISFINEDKEFSEDATGRT